MLFSHCIRLVERERVRTSVKRVLHQNDRYCEPKEQ